MSITLDVTNYTMVRENTTSPTQETAETKETAVKVDTVLYNPFSLDAQLAGKILACRTNQVVISLEDNQRFRQVNTSDRFGVIGLKPDIMADLAKSKQNQKGLKFSEAFDGKQEIPMAVSLADVDMDLSDLHLRSTLFNQVIQPLNYAGFTESAMQVVDFQLQMFDKGKDVTTEMLHNLWRLWMRLNNELSRSKKHPAADRLRVRNAKFGEHFQLPDPSQRYEMSDYAAFLAGLKSRISQNYRIIGIRLGKNVQRACLTTLNADDWIWAKRIISASHQHYINLSTNAHLRIATGNVGEKELKANNIDYDVFVN